MISNIKGDTLLMKRALLIGNQNYEKLDKLSFPENDVKKLKDIFEVIGFSVSTYVDVSFENMKEIISIFSYNVNDGDEIVFYFSGHGYHFEGNNYITPIDCKDYHEIEYADVLLLAYEDAAKVIDISLICDYLSKNKNGNNILVIDACRNIAEIKMYNDKRISNLVETSILNDNIFIAYVTSLGEFTIDNSIYATAISDMILRKYQTIDDLFNCVSDYVYNNSDAKIPCISKKTNKTYCFIDECNYCYEVEKQYYDEMFQIYIMVSSELSEVNIKDDFLNKYIYDAVKSLIYYPVNLLNLYIKKVITAFKEKLGLVYLLLEDEFFTTANIHVDSIFIEAKFGNGYRYDNNNFYNFNQCVEFIRNLQTKSSNVYIYKNKTIILMPYKNTNPFFQIINCQNNESLIRLVENPIRKIAKNDKTSEIMKLLIDNIENKKNILLVGDPHTNKEEFVSAFSEYFSEKDRILLINEDKKIDIRKGQISNSSTTFDDLMSKNVDELLNRMELVNKENITRVLYQNKAFRIDDEVFKALNKIEHCQFIATYDRDINTFLNQLKMQPKEHISSNYDLIVILCNCKEIGSFVHSIYVKENNYFDCLIKVDY
ncbi:MAG: caspase family protein [Hungatella sp.]|nr:caspase family protein [Hungatella sp.]